MALPGQFTDFRGGLNLRDAPYLLEDNQARDLANIQATVAGSIVKRSGLVTFASPASAATSLFALESVSPILLIAAVGTTLVSISTGGAVTSIKTGLTVGKPWEFISAPVVSTQGPLFGVNGTDTPVQGNAGGTLGSWTNATGGVAVPNGKYLIYSGNQAIISGVAATPSRVFWSAIGDPTNWDPASLTGAGFLDLDPNDGQAITAIGKVGPYILVAKPRKLWVVTDVATAANRRISDQVGCVSHRSMMNGAEGTYFLSEDRGVFLTNGSTVQPISDVVLPALQAVPAGLQAQCAGAYFNGHYYLSYPSSGSGSNDTVLDWDATLKSWWRHTFGSNQMVLWHPGGVASLYSAKSSSGIVDQCFAPGVTVDNGSPFTWVWRGPWQSPTFYRRRLFPTPYYRKRLRQVRLHGTGTVDFSLAKDFAGLETLVQANMLAPPNSAVWGATDGSVWGGTGLWGTPSVQFGRAYTLGVANAFSVVFSATSTTQDAIEMYLLVLKDRVDLVQPR